MKAASAVFAVLCLTMVSAAGAQQAQQITVSLANYAFTPSTLTLKAGETYRIHFSNDASKSHDFAAREFFKSSTVVAADKGKLEDGNEVELDGGQSADITLTPNRPGTYPVTCDHFMHAMLGMTGKVVVQ